MAVGCGRQETRSELLRVQGGVMQGGMMFARILRTAGLCLAVAASIAASGAAAAETYPAQPIKIVVGFGPASAADILTRLVGKRVEAGLGQPRMVENRAENSSMIEPEAVARATADGYTLFPATIANTLNPAQT